MELNVRDGFQLTSVRPIDKAAYLEYLNDPSISDIKVSEGVTTSTALQNGT